ncbi:response regulator [Deinococcus cellulosilyticus]|uniref:DNA-binding response regulator n=1 Tax=Deinococcus cellulosilyticus (strain DSM 18568 / NBRC 106333 / KACC 11606 / 5516J-15) TaxID=1223518 RepID=A0A511NAZ5_DEIC1|nr:response regulator transcription factor [Deinococcus cellulosilyticus]GEM49995.1 DNA-binding response regulator [Deinococcus cellulosilyticus NBRC 106333 = KACC 11606]
MISILLVDDHALVREGTHALLQQDPNLQVVGEARDGQQAIDLCDTLNPDIAIMDVNMPNMGGIEATRQIKRLYPRIAVLGLSAHDDEAFVMALLEAGAAGYLLKDAPGQDLIDAIYAAKRGESVIAPQLTQMILKRVRQGSEQKTEALTDREREVLLLAARGFSNKEIAKKLEISPKTVEVHLSALFEKLEVASRTEAVIRSMKRGIIQLSEL